MKCLVKNTAIMLAISLSLVGCGVDKGYNHQFKNNSAVEFSTDSINVSYDEMSGLQTINLLEGATVNGEPLTVSNSSSVIHIRDFAFTPRNDEFVTPQKPGIAKNQLISPFTIGSDGVSLQVDTDAYGEALRMCDETDEKGAVDADGNIIGNGVRDFPTSITYDITYVIDNGYELPPGQEYPVRNLVLTINAISDPVVSVQAFDVSVASGDSTPMLSATLPKYACNPKLTYDIEDATTAVVDENGIITGNNKGETTITVSSVENPALTATAKVNVTPGFNLAITNQDFNDLGAPLGTKSVPTCSAIGVQVEPSIVADNLSGNYTYAWSADNLVLDNEESDGAFGATGRFANTLAVGESATITVGYGSGYTGATAPEDVISQQVTVTAERNYACDPLPNANGDVFYVSDLKLNSGNWGVNAEHVPGGIDGTALKVTAGADGTVYASVTQQQWNQIFNFHAATYGRGNDSIGRKFKFSVWAKLTSIPSGEAKLEHTLLPWKCTGCDGLANFPARYDAGVAGSVEAILKPTTDWQLVEFINPLTGTNVWEVPAHWDQATPVFQFWNLFGFDANGSVLLDNYSVVEVE